MLPEPTRKTGRTQLGWEGIQDGDSAPMAAGPAHLPEAKAVLAGTTMSGAHRRGRQDPGLSTRHTFSPQCSLLAREFLTTPQLTLGSKHSHPIRVMRQFAKTTEPALRPLSSHQAAPKEIRLSPGMSVVSLAHFISGDAQNSPTRR